MKNFLITGLAISLLLACGQAEQNTAGDVKVQNFSWSLVTTWPKNYPGLGMAPERFSKLVDEMSQGQLKVTVYGAGEFVPAMGVFDAVSSGAVEMGHGGAYYWKGKFQLHSSLQAYLLVLLLMKLMLGLIGVEV